MWFVVFGGLVMSVVASSLVVYLRRQDKKRPPL